jgi:hypothetical protein
MSSSQTVVDSPAAHSKPKKHVRVINEKGHVDQDVVHISKGAEEEIVWGTEHKNVKVVFSSEEGSPFQESIFHVPAGGSVSSGPALKGAGHKAYKYTVKGEGGDNDPRVIIQN